MECGYVAPKSKQEKQGGGRVKTAPPNRNRQEVQSSEGKGSGNPFLRNTTQEGMNKDENNSTPCSSKYNLRSRSQLQTKNTKPNENKNQPTKENRNESKKEESATGHLDGSSPGPVNAQNSPREEISPKTIKKSHWTEEEVTELLWCYYYTNAKTTANEADVYKTWRDRNPNTRTNLDSKKLASQRRYLIKSGRITDSQVRKIRATVGATIREEMAEQREEREGKTENSVETTQTPEEKTQETTTPLKEDIKSELQSTEKKAMHERTPLNRITEDAKAKALIKQANKAVTEIIEENPEMNITQINHLIYASAKVITEKLQPAKENTNMTYEKPIHKRHEPPWAIRITKKIEELRKELSLLNEDGNTIKEKAQRKIANLKIKHKISSIEDRTRIKEVLKQKIQAYAQRIRRYKKRTMFRHQNRMFEINTKSFYRSLNEEKRGEEGPQEIDIVTFWSNIWEKPKKYEEGAEWIEEEERKYQDKAGMISEEQVTLEEINTNLNKAANWKASGIDKIPNFWIKRIKPLHHKIAKAMSEILANKASIPQWMTQGITHLIPKTGDLKQAKNYRPITCLPTLYKILTGIIAERVYNHLTTQNIMPPEQRGCCKGTYGSKELLLLNKAIMTNVRRTKKDLAIAWIDYQKAYDSVPHKWIIKALQIYKIHPNIVRFCERSMAEWNTVLNINTSNKRIQTRPIKIRSGIFQGDALSPLLFCIALIPLTNILNKDKKAGYQLIKRGEPITHALYMDDLKIFANTEEALKQQIEKVSQFTETIKMKFGLEKCAKAIIKKGKKEVTENIIIDQQINIKNLEPGETYKYLGVEEDPIIAQGLVKEKIRKEYLRRVRQILNTELTAKNKFQAIGTLATPVIEYSFGIIEWTQMELNELDRKTRKLLTINGLLHPRADIDRLYVTRREGGRGLRQIQASHEKAIVSITQYILKNENNSIVKQIKAEENGKKTKSIIQKAQKITEKYMNTEDLPEGDEDQDKMESINIKKAIQKQLKERWENKNLHGQFLKRTNKIGANKKKTFGWLTRGNIKGETEALITAAQDQALRTRNYEKVILKTTTDDRCRMCLEKSETIDHLISGCTQLAKTDYIERHDKVCSYLHHTICKAVGIQTTEKWYDHKPDPVTEGVDVTVIYNMPVNTDREIRANKPDIIIKNHDQKICTIIDVAIPNDSNITTKDAEKKLKYKDLEIETSRMWQMKSEVIPVIIGALGTIPENLQDHLKKLPGEQNEYQLQDIVLYGTARILRKII